MKRITWALFTFAALGFSACEQSIEHFEDDASAGSGAENATPNNPIGIDACEGVMWRNPSPGRVLCPGAPSCGCDLPTVCCSLDNTLDATSCQAFEQCTGVALGCDGPEDCGDNGECCGTEFAASCVAQGECRLDQVLLCRSDADCPLTRDTCTPSVSPAGVLGFCD